MIIGCILFLLFFGALPWVLFSYLPVWGAIPVNLAVSMFLLSAVHAAGKKKPNTLSAEEIIRLMKR
tara:strand:- start:11 stop:208 length:198 start_codon:yes stop_codon:yes gene_type:complete